MVIESALALFGVVSGAVGMVSGAAGLHSWYTGLNTGEQLKKILDEHTRTRSKVERLSDRILYTPSLEQVHNINSEKSKKASNLREVREILDPVQKALDEDLLSTAIISTPEKLKEAFQKNPWEVLIDVRPASYTKRNPNPDLIPILFEDNGTYYIGWQARGALPLLFNLDYSPDLTLSTVSSNSDVWKDEITGMEFVLVKGGGYLMGDCYNEGYEDEQPAHKVVVDDFYLGKYTVTQGEWKRIMGSNPSSFQRGDDYPVEQVSWNDTQKLINKLNERSSFEFRLPTEAEWEYAARERGRQVRFGNGKEVADPSEINFNGSKKYEKNYSVAGVYREETTRVGSFAPNKLGLYDMSGNVWEWVEDIYSSDLYMKRAKTSLIENPVVDKGNGVGRVLRGGSFYGYADGARSALRNYGSPGLRGSDLGFRLCRKI